MVCELVRAPRSGSTRALCAALVTFSALGVTLVARAQEPEQSGPIPTASSPATSAEALGEQDEPLARARAAVALAEPLFAAGHYAAALAEYSRAHQILAGHPRQYWVLHNLAVCNERLFRYDLAVELYEEYLRRAPPTESDRREVEAILGTLRSLLATLVIESSPVGEVWLDDRRLGDAPGRWRVPAGRHIVEVRAEHHESQRREVQLDAGQIHVDRFQLDLLSTYAGPPPGYFWAAVTLTGLAAAAGASAGFMALSAREDGRQKADLYLDTSDESQRTRRLALAADIGFGAAAVFGASATVLYFVTDWGKADRKRESSSQRALSVGLAAPGGIGATLRGNF